MSQKISEWGDDNEKAWNDRHLQHAYLWLIKNPQSPYQGSIAMLFEAMHIGKEVKEDFKKAFRLGKFARYRFTTRLTMTKRFQDVLAGKFIPVVLQRNSLGRVIKWKILPNPNPQPLPCPPFYRGSIRITTRGLELALKRTDANLAPKHDPKGKERLLNPFGSV